MSVIELFNEDCTVGMKRYPDNYFDSVVTDAPYELGFMGKAWDKTGIAYNVELWKEVLRVLKPGGHLLSFGGSRTYHRMACAIEDAGFEIRDQIMWVYGSGFPKSLNIGKAVDKLQGNEREVLSTTIRTTHKKGTSYEWAGGNDTGICDNTKGNSEWEGWGTALKPAHEPICMARKPLSEKTVAINVLKWGTGGINIDGCRVEGEPWKWGTQTDIRGGGFCSKRPSEGYIFAKNIESNPKGRFPANLIHDGSEEVVEGFPDRKTTWVSSNHANNRGGKFLGQLKHPGEQGFNDSGSASRFFKQCEYSQEDLCEIANIVEKSLTLQNQVGDFVLNLVAIEGNPEDKQLNAILQPFMSEMRKQLNKNIGNDTQMIISIGKKCLQELSRTITERLKNNHVKNVEIQKLINTMMIIQNLLNIDGFVGVVISDTMLLNMVLGEKGYESRFKYCAKASKSERDAGLEGMEEKLCGMMEDDNYPIKTGSGNIRETKRRNNHPTVKPIALMEYLIKLVTPPNGTVLDPFMGSGTTGMACQDLGFSFVGFEIDKEYYDIAVKRIEGHRKQEKLLKGEDLYAENKLRLWK